jgi:DNA-binding MarR family transcriptional regulator
MGKIKLTTDSKKPLSEALRPADLNPTQKRALELVALTPVSGGVYCGNVSGLMYRMGAEEMKEIKQTFDSLKGMGLVKYSGGEEQAASSTFVYLTESGREMAKTILSERLVAAFAEMTELVKEETEGEFLSRLAQGLVYFASRNLKELESLKDFPMVQPQDY